MDLIERSKAIEAIQKLDIPEDMCVFEIISHIETEIATLPPAKQVILCKDCEWWTKQSKSLQGRCELMHMYPTGEWFCGNAKKRVTANE